MAFGIVAAFLWGCHVGMGILGISKDRITKDDKQAMARSQDVVADRSISADPSHSSVVVTSNAGGLSTDKKASQQSHAGTGERAPIATETRTLVAQKGVGNGTETRAFKMLRSRKKFKWCLGADVYHYKYGAKWNNHCSCEDGLYVGKLKAKVCMFELYGQIVSIYEPLYSSMGPLLGYEFGEKHMYQKAFLPPLPTNSTVIDIGANLGLFSILIAMLNPSAHVRAYEANPYTIAFTKYNVKANKLTSQVMVRNFALTDRDKKIIKVYDCSENIGKTRTEVTATQEQMMPTKGFDSGRCGTQDVYTITFEKILLQLRNINITQVDMLKLDCEGCERHVLPQIPSGVVKAACGECHLDSAKEPTLAKQCTALLGEGE